MTDEVTGNIDSVESHDAFPKTFRTVMYAVGAATGAAAVSLYGAEDVAPWLPITLGAISAAANVLALGYNPNRNR